MPTYLFKWNPRLWPGGSLADELAAYQSEGSPKQAWSTGNRKNFPIPSRFFLLRTGPGPRGLIGSGWTDGKGYRGPHWDGLLREQGKTANYVPVDFDILAEYPIVPLSQLMSGRTGEFRGWSNRGSGDEFPPDIALRVEALWRQATGAAFPPPDTLDDPRGSTEGAKQRITINRYERSAGARKACLDHFGTRCCACGFSFAEKYGDVAEGVIQVHHLEPLSTRDQEYRVEPVRDLRPLCANCHVVAHLKRPEPYTIEELRAFLVAP